MDAKVYIDSGLPLLTCDPIELLKDLIILLQFSFQHEVFHSFCIHRYSFAFEKHPLLSDISLDEEHDVSQFSVLSRSSARLQYKEDLQRGVNMRTMDVKIYLAISEDDSDSENRLESFNFQPSFDITQSSEYSLDT